MKRNFTFFAILIISFLSAFCLAQTNQETTKEDFKPAVTNQPGKEYPQVNSERRVRAQISAPEAHKVQLDISAVKYDLTKDSNGVWTGESGPQDEGFHYYQLWIDGAAVPDPGSKYFYGAMRWGSGIETKLITLKNLDTFSSIDLFSGGSISPEDVNNTPGFKEKVKLVFVSFGSREIENMKNRPRTGPFGGDPKEDIDAISKEGINAHFYVSPNTAHEWESWRRSLHEFAQLLFKD